MQASGDGNFKKVSVYTSVPDQLTHPKGGKKIFGKVTSLVSFPIHTYVYAQCTFIGTLFLLVRFINQLFIFPSMAFIFPAVSSFFWRLISVKTKVKLYLPATSLGRSIQLLVYKYKPTSAFRHVDRHV